MRPEPMPNGVWIEDERGRRRAPDRIPSVTVIDRQLVPAPVRRHFRDLSASAATQRLIAGMWEDQGFVASGLANTEVGVRRSLWHEYEDSVDWTDLDHVMRVLRVYETVLDGTTEATVDATRKLLRRQGFSMQPDGTIKLTKERLDAAVARVPGARLPGSLAALRDPSMILDSFDRIHRALPSDPAQAIGSAKELVEATAKTVLKELGLPFDDKTAKLPGLVEQAQRALHLSPQSHMPGPDGSNAVKRILGGLTSIAVGLGEFRNEGWGTGHASPRAGLRQRHANLAVGAAHVWCHLILDTLADHDAPWRAQAPVSAAAAPTT